MRREKLTASQVRQRRARLARKGTEPTEPEYDANLRVAAKAVDNKARVARGEEPVE